jgi:hypothetical protein
MTSTAATLPVLSERVLEKLQVFAAGAVDLRRDLYRFLGHVEEKGLVRTRRGNDIPKTDARRLAKRLSWAREAEVVEESGRGHWSDYVSHLARRLGLVQFDIKGEYLGYTSTEPSFVDNEIGIEEKAWSAFLKKPPLEKEIVLLDSLLEYSENEFFSRATLRVGGEPFDGFGCATGPASRMKLPAIRRRLLEMLAALEPDRWYEFRGLVELVKKSAPAVILDPSSRRPDPESEQRLRQWEWEARERRGKAGAARRETPAISLEDIYTNFRESKGGEGRYRSERFQITSQTPDAFQRVEGRYLEFFLREVPYMAGFVDLAYRAPQDKHGLEVSPPRERLCGFRLTRRLRQVVCRDPELNRVKVTVLPTFEVLVEASSYPEGILETLTSYAEPLREDGPLHTLRLERKKVVDSAAQDPKGPSASHVLQALAGSPLPENVASELAAWSGHGEKVTFYEGFGLVELGGGEAERRGVLEDLGALVAEKLGSWAIVRHPDKALGLLEKRGRVPLRVKHRDGGFASSPGRWSAREGKGPKGTKSDGSGGRQPPSRLAVRLEAEDLIGYRSSDPSLLAALEEALRGKARTAIVCGELFVVSAAALPELRKTLRRLAERFEVTIAAGASGGNGT